MKRVGLAALTTGIYLAFIGLILFFKPYQCIDSSVVEKFDILMLKASTHETKTVYQCSVKKSSEYSEKTEDYLEKITPRLERLILVLESSKPFAKKIHLIVDEKNPLAFKVTDQQITIGKALLESAGHLERAVIKVWLNGQSTSGSAKLSLFDESLTDLVYFSVFGEFNIFDPINQLQPKIGSAKWPQVLKNLDSYCESSWKISEDYEKCAALNISLNNQLGDDSNANVKRKEILTISLRPLLTSSLIKSYSELNFTNQTKIMKLIPEMMISKKINSENAIDYLLSHESPLKEGLSIIRIFSEIFSPGEKSQIYERQFSANINHYLQNQGVSDSFAEAYFDVLVEFPDQLNEKSDLFKSLQSASIENLNLQIAVKDNDQIWILPSKSGLSSKIFDKVKIRQHVFFACPILKNIEMNQFVETSEKLLMIKGCDSNRAYAFDLLFKYGVPDFTKKETDLAFIQFHLPSLVQRLDELKHIQNYFELVKNRDVTQQEFQKLGWQDVQWNEQYHFYKPKAAIDAIEYFR